MSRTPDRATMGEIVAKTPDARQLPPVLRYYAQPGQHSAARRSVDGTADDWQWAATAAERKRQ